MNLMKILIGVILYFFMFSVDFASARPAKPPAAKAFMEVYSNMHLVPVENDFVGHQISVFHVIQDPGEELRILWQAGVGGLSVPQLLTPEKKGNAWVIHVDHDGDWTLRIGDARIEAVSPRGEHETLGRIRSLN